MRGRAFHRFQTALMPPSTTRSIPATKLLSSDARKRAALATSSARPIRPSGITETKLLLILSAPSFVAAWESMIGVSMGRG